MFSKTKFCIDSMAMPRCLFFGLVGTFPPLLLPFLVGSLSHSCILPYTLLVNILLFTDQKMFCKTKRGMGKSYVHPLGVLT